LLKTVVAEKSQLEREQRLRQKRREIRALIERGNPSAALAELKRAEREYTDDPGLAQLRADAEEQQAVSNALVAMQAFEQRSQPDAALSLTWNPELRRCTRRSGYPPVAVGESRFDHLHFTVCQGQKPFVRPRRVCGFAS